MLGTLLDAIYIPVYKCVTYITEEMTHSVWEEFPTKKENSGRILGEEDGGGGHLGRSNTSHGMEAPVAESHLRHTVSLHAWNRSRGRR